MAIRAKNFIQRKLSRLKSALKEDLASMVREGSLATAIERYRQEARVDDATAAEVIMGLQCSLKRGEFLARARDGLRETGGLLKEDLLQMVTEGATADAIEWCTAEAGIDPKAARTVVQHLREDPKQLLNAAGSELQQLDPALQQEIRSMLQHGHSVAALERLREKTGSTMAGAASLLSTLQRVDAQAGTGCRVAATLQQMDERALGEIRQLLVQGRLVTALEKIRADWKLDMISAKELLDRLRS
ncbi:MAG: hypothetical protein HY319_18735 [Armatimonadetes bacterium]|nr:hypothetical protein [Armatimonadota bacterium]